MDTGLTPSASGAELSNGVLILPLDGTGTTETHEPRRIEFSADTMRRARIALAEYARSSGMYDPEDVLAFTRLCIQQAAAQLGAVGDGDALVQEAIRVASITCGVCRRRKDENMVAVPTLRERTMPPQPLGELPDVRPTQLWNSIAQTLWRAVGTALSFMFARSE